MCAAMGVGDQTERADWWRKLRMLYMGPGRFYHTLQHIDELFEKVRVCKNERASVRACVWTQTRKR